MNQFRLTYMKKGALITVLLLVLLNVGHAQFKNVKLDDHEVRAANCEPAIAVSPKDPTGIVAVSMGHSYHTKDGGATWQKKKVESPLGVYGDPALIADSHGEFYYFHLSADPAGNKSADETGRANRIAVQYSGDGGDTWSVGEPIGMEQLKDQDKVWPTLDVKNNFYVTWTQFDKYGDSDANCQSHIMISTSRNGKKWSDPYQVSQVPGNCVADGQTAAGGVPAATLDGKLFVAWARGGKIYLDRSFDGGSMWLSTDLAVADQRGGWRMTVPGHDRVNGLPVLMTDKSKSPYRNSLYVVWADQRNGEDDTDIWFIRSTNYGDNWTQPMKVNNEGIGTHQYLPSMTIDNTTGYIYILYYDRRNYVDLQTDVYLAYSLDGGLKFTNVKVSDAPFTPSPEAFFGDGLNLSAHKGIVTPIWLRTDNGRISVMTTVIKHDDLVKMK